MTSVADTSGMDEGRQFSAQQRKTAAKKGQAQGDGSFPIKNESDLKNAIRALGRSKNKAATKAHIIRRAKALGLTKLLPSGWTKESAMKLMDKKVVVDGAGRVVQACHDTAEALDYLRSVTVLEPAKYDGASLGVQMPVQIECYDPSCDRSFLDFDLMTEHAEAVHTFDDIQRMVSDAVREKYAKRGDYKATPPVPSVYAWVCDVADDWVVFQVDSDGDVTLYKASYTLDAEEDEVTLGDPVKVVRRTVYDPIK